MAAVSWKVPQRNTIAFDSAPTIGWSRVQRLTKDTSVQLAVGHGAPGARFNLVSLLCLGGVDSVYVRWGSLRVPVLIHGHFPVELTQNLLLANHGVSRASMCCEVSCRIPINLMFGGRLNHLVSGNQQKSLHVCINFA